MENEKKSSQAENDTLRSEIYCVNEREAETVAGFKKDQEDRQITINALYDKVALQDRLSEMCTINVELNERVRASQAAATTGQLEQGAEVLRLKLEHDKAGSANLQQKQAGDTYSRGLRGCSGRLRAVL